MLPSDLRRNSNTRNEDTEKLTRKVLGDEPSLASISIGYWAFRSVEAQLQRLASKEYFVYLGSKKRFKKLRICFNRPVVFKFNEMAEGNMEDLQLRPTGEVPLEPQNPSLQGI
jgi:hypothetical protein